MTFMYQALSYIKLMLFGVNWAEADITVFQDETTAKRHDSFDLIQDN